MDRFQAIAPGVLKCLAHALLLTLNMLVVTLRGEAYAYDEVKKWLESTGFVNVSRADIRHLPGYSLVLATKPA